MRRDINIMPKVQVKYPISASQVLTECNIRDCLISTEQRLPHSDTKQPGLLVGGTLGELRFNHLHSNAADKPISNDDEYSDACNWYHAAEEFPIHNYERQN